MPVSLWLTSQLEKEFKTYAGVDEVGLGCWAGPIYAGAVVIRAYDTWPEVDQLKDSKTVGPRKRTFIAQRIKEECDWAIGQASNDEIDEFGIRFAHSASITRAVRALTEKLGRKVDGVVIDGQAFDIELDDIATRFVVHGDDLIPAISAASILAKVERDALMDELDKEYPEYGWKSNNAYQSPQHRQALQEIGLTPYHRRSVKPVGRIAAARGDCCDGTKPACCFLHRKGEQHEVHS